METLWNAQTARIRAKWTGCAGLALRPTGKSHTTRPMNAPFSRIALFLVAICGWAILGFGAVIASRGVLFYDWDAVLMGTGGGLAIGGLLVVALTIGAQAQLATARDTAAMRAALEARPKPRAAVPERGDGKPTLRPVKTPQKQASSRPEPRLKR